MFKFITRIFLIVLVGSFLSTALSAAKHKKHKGSATALTTSLVVGGVLGLGAGIYALVDSIAYSDPVADNLADGLLLCRWREHSMWPLRHTWWDVLDMKKDRKNVKKYMIKDLSDGSLMDGNGNKLTNTQEFIEAVDGELKILQETKTADSLRSLYNKVTSTITSWFGKTELNEDNKKISVSVTRLIDRLNFMKKVADTIPFAQVV